MMRRMKLSVLAVVLVVAGMAIAQGTDLIIKEDAVHVRTWNEFAANLLRLHERRLAEHEVRTTEKTGGYMRRPEFFDEVSYHDAETGRLLSRIQWERENPNNVHVIEVFIYDEQGRVIRDYTAAFLPGFRNAPNQTLINFHSYNGSLHAFRSFDASGERIYERCQGEYTDEEVFISLEDVDIEDALREPQGIMSTPEYKACFSGIPVAAGEYLVPH